MKEQNSIFILIVLLLFIVGGSFTINNQNDIKSSYSNGSGYRLKLLNANQTVKDSSWVQINIQGKDDEFIKGGTVVTIGCEKINVVNGKLSLLRKIDVEYIFRTSSVGYYSVETEPLFFKENDSIVINFVLGEDHRPFINCEGMSIH